MEELHRVTTKNMLKGDVLVMHSITPGFKRVTRRKCLMKIKLKETVLEEKLLDLKATIPNFP